MFLLDVLNVSLYILWRHECVVLSSNIMHRNVNQLEAVLVVNRLVIMISLLISFLSKIEHRVLVVEDEIKSLENNMEGADAKWILGVIDTLKGPFV